MSRELTAFVQSALADENLEPFFAVDLLFDSPSEIYVWTGMGSIAINGRTYVGDGEILGLSDIAESSEVEALGASVTLSGLPQALLQKAIAEPYQGRECRIYFGLMANPDAMIEMFTGYMDTMPIEDGAEVGTIRVQVENKLVDLERPRVLKLTHADQSARYPGDMGLSYVAGIQDQKLPWGLGVPG